MVPCKRATPGCPTFEVASSRVDADGAGSSNGGVLGIVRTGTSRMLVR